MTAPHDPPPWEELRAAEARLTAAREWASTASRPADVHAAGLAVEKAAADVDGWKVACGALVAELLLYAAGADGVRQTVARTLDGLEPADGFARSLCEDLGRCVEWLAREHQGQRDVIADLKDRTRGMALALARLTLRVEDIEQQVAADERAAGSLVG